MPKPRKPENRGLPARWRFAHGAYYYRVPSSAKEAWDNKQLFRLGTTKAEAYRVWAERLGSIENVQTIGQLLDRYAMEVIPLKAAGTQDSNGREIKLIREVFGGMKLTDLRPQHIYQYVDKRGKKVAAHREIKLLSHAFTKAVQWGYINSHPFKGEVRLEGEAPRTRYIEDAEVLTCLAVKPVRKGDGTLMVQAYIRLKLLTGMGMGDLLRLEPARHFLDDGILNQRHKTKKTGKATIYEWDDALREAVQMALEARPVELSPFLFCNREGKGYINAESSRAPGFSSVWQRFIKRAGVKFSERDLRAKVASDNDLEHARKLLAHADSRMTQRVYRRLPERVKSGSQRYNAKNGVQTPSTKTPQT